MLDTFNAKRIFPINFARNPAPHMGLVLEKPAPFIGFSYEILARLWVTILGHPTHIPS